MAKQGSEMMAGDRSTAQGGEQLSAKDSNEVNKITRPGRYSMRNNRPESSTGRLKPKLCCTGCGNKAHPKGVPCPAWGKNCLRSRKSNQFARACPNRKPNHFGRQVRALEGDPDPSTSHPEEESMATEEVYLYCDIADEYDPGHIMQADLTVITETF